jgi:hypothetical protein
VLELLVSEVSVNKTISERITYFSDLISYVLGHTYQDGNRSKYFMN